MNEPLLVVLVGESLLISGVAASLQKTQMLGVIQLNTDEIGLKEKLGFLKPDLIVFDLDVPDKSFVFCLLTECPGVQFIGIESDRNRTIVMSSQQYQTHKTNELFQLMQAVVEPNVSQLKGGGLIDWKKETAVYQPKHL